MTPDPLQELWISQKTADKENVMNSIQVILDEDKICRDKERRTNLWLAPVYLLLLPLLFLCAALGKTPMVRAGYALMACGLAVALSAVWLFNRWARQALPGPADTRSQLQKAAFILSRQANLASTSSLWIAPLFLGGGLIGLWIYQERGHLEAFGLWAILGSLWLWATFGGMKKAKAALETMARIEQLLRDLG